MTPDFKIVANSQDVTDKIKSELISLRVKDEAGIKSDKVEIELNDSGGRLEFPSTGSKLEIYLGYKETYLIKTGIYLVDEISISNPPQILKVSAHASDMSKDLRTPKTKEWGRITIFDLVDKIASSHKLTAKVGIDLRDFEIPYLSQTEESDLHLLTRIAKNHGAIVKPVYLNLLFVKKDNLKSISGKLIEPVTLDRKDITNWNARFVEREKYKSVKAFWYDKDLASKQEIIIGDSNPIFTIRGEQDSEKIATSKAEAKLNEFKRGTGSLNLSMPGNIRLFAEGILNLKNIHRNINGSWRIKTVEHVLDNSGYKCNLTCSSEIKK